MKILVDENIPCAQDAFASWGEVVTCAGRKINASLLQDVDLLIVRSVTRVDEDLIRNSPVRFVGTCTIGTDHVDQAVLQKRGVHFASAPGSNSESVAEYVTAALLVLSKRRGIDLRGKCLGVVGVGNVGSRVARNAQALGLDVILNDPPLERLTGDSKYKPIESVYDADFVTLHVPLTRTGPDPTYHLVDAEFLRKLKDGCIVLNTSRGAVVDNESLLHALQRGSCAGAVLDVWENEPDISPELLAAVDLGTPHIAGYSYDGKVLATEMIYRSACSFLGITPEWSSENVLAACRDDTAIWLDTAGRTETQLLEEVVRAVYDISRDDADFRDILAVAPEERAAYFDRLRKEYPRRLEAPGTSVTLVPHHTHLAETLKTLRFQLVASPGIDS